MPGPVAGYLDAHRQEILDLSLSHVRQPSIKAQGVGVREYAGLLRADRDENSRAPDENLRLQGFCTGILAIAHMLHEVTVSPGPSGWRMSRR